MPSKKTYQPRRARPGQAFSTVDPGGKETTIKADEQGLVQPSNDAEQAVADRFGLPVARKTDSAGDGGKE